MTSVNNLLNKKFKKAYKIDPKDSTSPADFLSEIGRLLDKEQSGLDPARKTKNYQNMYKQLIMQELELPVSIKPPNFDLLERAYQLSYGLLSFNLFITFAHQTLNISGFDEFTEYQRNLAKKITPTYLKALAGVKATIIKSSIEELKL